jgi:hypothetical protein
MPPIDGPDDLHDVTPGANSWPRVEFRGQARPEPAARRQRREKELAYVFGTFRSDVELVLVVKEYFGYAKPSDDKVISGVELRFCDGKGFETHIVKLGTDDEVGRDATNWEACTRGREVASRIFTPAFRVDIRKSGRVAVIYRNAYTLFGPSDGKDVAPQNLETVVGDAVFTNTVDPRSVERAVAHVFTDLSLWFFHGAMSNPKAARKFYLKELVSVKHDKDAFDLWTRGARLDLRRDALWLFCGRDRPDHNHALKPARYLDPVELVGWALDAGRPSEPLVDLATQEHGDKEEEELETFRMPETLVGRGHGDLHGRNVLLGVRRREAEYPAVFDYGGMGECNALAWDFAKLETELKVRLLQQVYRNSEAHKAIRKERSWTWKVPAAPHDATTYRAERLRFFFVFEEMLAERTAWITNPAHARAWQPPGGRKITRVTALDRLLAVLLRIRQEAALALGFTAGRLDEWRDELYFALAVYGLVNARWKTYTPEEQESALVSAGVAAAHAPLARAAVAKQAHSAAPPEAPYPSYRVPLAHAHRLWKAHRHPEGKKLLDDLIGRYDHAVPLIAEHALFWCDAGEWRAVEDQLHKLHEKAKAFDDEETLARLGRAFKEMADESWERDNLPFDQLGGHPAVQFYRLALEAYEDAYHLGGDYFPGVNVAALALLVGDVARAQEVAKRLLAECKAKPMPRGEVYWIFATEGDAAFILGDGAAALRFYGNALAALQVGEEGHAVSSYRQLLRLRGPLGAALVNPVLDLFRNHPLVGQTIRERVARNIPG